MNTEIRDLSDELIELNRLYRLGRPIVSDESYDNKYRHLKRINTDDVAFTKVDYVQIKDARKEKMPAILASVGNVYNMEEFKNFVQKYGLEDFHLVFMPKYDGVAVLSDETKPADKKAWRKNEMDMGYNISHHFEHIEKNNPKKHFDIQHICYGECIIKIDTFNKHYAEEFKNPRNFVSGKTNPLTASSDYLADFDYVRYGLIDSGMDKIDQLNYLNKINKMPVPYKVMLAKDVTEDAIVECYREWGKICNIDGIVIEVNDNAKRIEMGYNNNHDPKFNVAYKGDFGDKGDTVLLDIISQVSKDGLLKPVLVIDAVNLDGTTVKRCFADNWKFVKQNHLIIGSKLRLKKGGMIIPRVVENLSIELDKYVTGNVHIKNRGYRSGIPSDSEFKEGLFGTDDIDFMNASEEKMFRDLHSFSLSEKPTNDYVGNVFPHECPTCFGELEWTGADGEEVDLMCTNPDCPDKNLHRIVHFFETLKAKGVSDSTISEFIDHGYDSIKKILELTGNLRLSGADGISTMAQWHKWGVRKAELVCNAINKSIQNVPLHVYQHASGYFPKLGSTKLGWLKDLKNPTFDQIMAVKGFDVKTAEIYCKNIDKFWEFASTLPVSVAASDDISASVGKFDASNWVVVFTGFRNDEWKKIIEHNGGKVASAVSSKTTHLIIATEEDKRTKYEKAVQLGVKNIMMKDDFESILYPKNKSTELSLF